MDLILFLDPLLTHVYIHLEGPLICEPFGNRGHVYHLQQMTHIFHLDT